MLKTTLFLTLISFMFAQDTNSTKSIQKDSNSTKVKVKKEDSNSTKKNLLQKHLQEQIEKEKKYAKEKMFYMGKDYNLTEHEVDPNTLKHIKTIEPDYDFDMDEGVYSD